MHYSSYILILLILDIVLSFFFGLVVFIANRGWKETINRRFFVFTISAVIWQIANLIMFISVHQPHDLMWTRSTYLTGTFAAYFLLRFMIVFPKTYIMNQSIIIFLDIFGLLLTLIAGLLSLLPDTITAITYNNNFRNPNTGSNFIFFALILAFLVLSTIIIGIINYIRSNTPEKIKMRYMLIGTAILLFLIIFTDVISPSFMGSNYLSNFDAFSLIFLFGFTYYAIAKHQLFNIKIILTESAMGLVMIAIFVQTLFATSKINRWVDIVLLLLISYGSYLLLKSVKKEIRQREQLQTLAKKLDKANQDLEELDEAKDNFLSMASHELNTPIAAIEGYLSMIIEEKSCGKLNPQLNKYLTNVFLSSQRLAGLVKDLLNVSRIESNRIHLIYTEVQIEDIIEQSIAEVKIKADEVGHKLIFEKPKGKLPKTYIDAPRIIEVIINIVGNAIKYTDPPGKIVVDCHADGDKIVISVEDNGRGIPKDKYDHVFEKFTQVNVLTDQIKGTGLGMFITKNLIEMHKGKVWFKSSVDEKDHGTTFYFSLPILKTKPFDPHEGEGALFQTGQKTTNSITEAEQKAAEEKAEKIPDIVKIQEPTQEQKTNPPAGGQDSEKTANKEAEELEPEPDSKPEDKPSNKPPEKQAVDIKSQSL